MSELYVYGKWYSRGEEGVVKYRVEQADIEKAIEVQKGTDDEKDAFLEEISSQREYGQRVWEPLLFNAIVHPEAEVVFNPKGFGVWHEEAEFGVGPTKNAARLEFTKVHTDEEDGGDEDW